MRICFHGAAGTTTGSMHVVEVAGRKLLLDCGLFQGRRKEAFERNRQLPFDAKALDACILSHAHIDHSGNLPGLVKAGFRGSIFTTAATRDLCAVMLEDSARLQESDVRFVNKVRIRQGQRPFEPLYVPADVPPVMERFRPLGYGARAELFPGAAATFRDAGHILGSAIVSLDLSENGRTVRLVFSGDLGRPGQPILRDPENPGPADALIVESTYGDRLHPKEEDVRRTLTELFAKIVARRSRLIIPAFSVGRTQQLLYFLHGLWKAGRLPTVPVYVDSPLSNKATEVYRKHPECYDAETLSAFAGGESPFADRALTFVTDAEDSKKLNEMKGPLVVISASGMCEGGRVLHHLKHSVEDPANVILLVGFQAENTLGRRIQDRQPIVRILGVEYHLRAEVASVGALSAHADRDELLSWVRGMGQPPRRAFVVHGEPPASEALAGEIRNLGGADVLVPAPGQTAEL